MNQRDADSALPASAEVTTKTVWPTIAATGAGRLVGRLAAVQLGPRKFFTLGKLLTVATIPISLFVFAWQLLPWICRRYTLTNRRLVIRKGYSAVEEKSIDLEAFDSIELEVLPGQQWLHSGELAFRRAETEVFRLSGVSRPEVFRQVCLQSRSALVSVNEVLQHQ